MDASKTQKRPPSTDSYLEGFLEPLTDLARRLDTKGLGKDAALQKLVEENIKAQVRFGVYTYAERTVGLRF